MELIVSRQYGVRTLNMNGGDIIDLRQLDSGSVHHKLYKGQLVWRTGLDCFDNCYAKYYL